MGIISRYFAKKISVDAYPSKFIFSRMDNNLTFSIETFIYLEYSDSMWTPRAIGEEIRKEQLTSDIYRFDLFESQDQSLLEPKVDSDALLQIFFEYGIGKCLSSDFLPNLRPVVFVLGTDRLIHKFQNPKAKFNEILKRAGAAVVIFDKTEF